MNERELNKKEFIETSNDLLSSNLEIEKKKQNRDFFIKNQFQPDDKKDVRDKKIMDQAKRLCELQDYVIICERKIKQLTPTQELPLTEKHLRTVLPKDESHNKEIENLNQIIKLKEEEIQRLNGITLSLKNKNGFVTQEKISNEKIRESYTKLLFAFNSLTKEKESILDNLRAETLLNEEQKNYIEILKQSLDSKLSKFGLTQLINHQKSNYNDKSITNEQVIADMMSLKFECENSNKEVGNYKELVFQLKDEINKCNKINQDLTSNNIELKKEIFTIKNDFEKNREDANSQDKEVKKQQKLIELIKEEKKSLQNSYDLIFKENTMLDKEHKDLFRKNCELELKVSEINQIKGKYDEALHSCNKLKEDIDKVIREKDCINVERNCYKNNMEEKNNLIDKLTLSHKEISEKLEKVKKDMDNENQVIIMQNMNLEKKNMTLKIENEEISRNYKNLEEKCEKLNNLNRELIDKNDNQNSCFEDLKKNFENQFELFEQSLEELDKSNRNLKDNIQELSHEKEKLMYDLNFYKEELISKEEEKKKVEKNYELSEKNISNLTLKTNNLYHSIKILEKEKEDEIHNKENLLRDFEYFKEKTEYELKLKNNELSDLYENSNLNKNEIISLRQDLNHHKEYNIHLNRQLKYLGNENHSLKESSKNLMKDSELLKERDLEITEKSEKIKYLNKKLEDQMKETEEIMRESNSKNKQLTEFNMKYEKLLKEKISDEENSREIKNSNNDLKELIKKLQSNIKSMEKEISEMKDKEETFLSSISLLQQTKFNFEDVNNKLQNKHNELKDIYKETFEEKAKYESLLAKFDEELDKSRKNEKENYNKILAYQNTFNELKLAMNSCMSFHKIVVNKSSLSFANDEISIVSSKFKDFLLKFTDNLNHSSYDCLTIDSIKYLEEWSRIVSTELETYYNNIQKLSEQNSNKSVKIQKFEKESHEHLKLQEGLNVELKKLNSKIYELKEEKRGITEELENMKIKNDKVIQEQRRIDQELKKAYLDNNNLIKDLEKQNELKLKLEGERTERSILAEKFLNLKQSQETRIHLLEKEKGNNHNLILKLAKSFPSRKIIKIVNTMMKNSEEMFSIEKEKFRIDYKLKKVEQEISLLKNCDSESTGDFKDQIDQLKQLLREIEDKIDKKIDIQAQLEKKVEIIEAEERKKGDCIYEYEIKIRQLENQLNETVNNVNQIKQFKNDYREKEFNFDKTTQSMQNDMKKGSAYLLEKATNQNSSKLILKLEFIIKNLNK